MRKLIFALLIIVSPCVFAHGWITDISVSESVVAQGREINLKIVTGCADPSFVSALDLGNGQLEFELEEGPPGPVVGVCRPHGGTYDLRDYFNLSAGEYSLKVIDKSAGDEQEPAEFSFVVQADLFEIVPAMSGSWYDPENPGHGVSTATLDDGIGPDFAHNPH